MRSPFFSCGLFYRPAISSRASDSPAPPGRPASSAAWASSSRGCCVAVLWPCGFSWMVHAGIRRTIMRLALEPTSVIDTRKGPGLASAVQSTGEAVMGKRSIALAVAFALAAGFNLNAGAQAPASKSIKMQSTWPASNTLQEHFKIFAERVDKLTAGGLKIEAMPAGQIVPPFEVLDATNKKVLDGWHAIAYYWVGKNPAAALFAAPPGGPFGMDHMDYLGWLYVGGGLEMWRDFYQNDLKLNVIVWPAHPSSPQAFGWFKKPLRSVADIKGLKCRQTGLNAEDYAKMGMSVVNMAGGGNVPAGHGGVVEVAAWGGGGEDLRLGLHSVFKYHY